MVKCVCRICPPPVPKNAVHRSAREMLSTAHVISCHPGSFKGNDKASRATTKASRFPRHLFETCFLELFDVNMKTLPNSLDTMSTSYAIETSGPGAAFTCREPTATKPTPKFHPTCKMVKMVKMVLLVMMSPSRFRHKLETPVVIDGA